MGVSVCVGVRACVRAYSAYEDSLTFVIVVLDRWMSRMKTK